MKAINNKQPDPLIVCMIIYLLALAVLVMSCNPVKQVLRDKRKLDQVAAVVLASGYCANDTTVIVISDTLIKSDTVTTTTIEIQRTEDTVYFWETKYHTIKERVFIRDTVKAVIVDKARINELEKQKLILSTELSIVKEQSKKRMRWIYIIIAVVIGYLFLKLRFKL
jgi:hypothetical protein